MLVAGEQLANARSAGRGTHLSLPSLLFLLEEAGPDGGYSGVICKITGVELEEVDQPRERVQYWLDISEKRLTVPLPYQYLTTSIAGGGVLCHQRTCI